jgi:DNA-binding CsgD family transcriptional regulator
MDAAERRRVTALCGVAAALMLLRAWTLNVGVFPQTSTVFPLARELQTAVGVVLPLPVALVSLHCPRALAVRPLTAVALACALVGAAPLLAWPGSPLAVTLGLVVHAMARCWIGYLFGLACCRVGATRGLAVSLALGSLAATLASWIMPQLDYVAAVILLVAFLVAELLLLTGPAAPLAVELAMGLHASELALASPRSFVRPTARVFVLIVIFSAAFGLALALGSVAFSPLVSPIQFVATGAVAVWFAVSGDRPWRDDALFAIAACLVVAGLLATSLPGLARAGVANGLLNAGSRCFQILTWLALAAMCARNRVASYLILSYGSVATSGGTFLGADLGHALNALARSAPDVPATVTAAIVLALFAYALVGLRGFSFAATIRGIEPPRPVSAPDVATPDRAALFARSVDDLAATAGLTSRERQVCDLLAHGRNASHIQQELTISYNTAKTHVKRVYAKLGVHSQQELIDLVEQGMRA